ncbi:guanine nucleotide-binding protein G(s) subunit alpha [Trichonephila clavata]|uniref:Guanine nucleotide-binding protein G(s) subunit alpha n=1 Tax=Trichonephila clavata TaxID=2740835 RepID=A0A8X6F4X5_TRICU|nr:guanine nucleotide-binding protein G(s) subunit alpha [Trichonephila clavata]
MACCMTSDPNRRHSRTLDKEISQRMKDYKKIVKFLLLGAGESGKSTIIKQMRILHTGGFSDSERKEKILDVKRNILEAIKELIGAMNRLNPPEQLSDEANKAGIEYIDGISLIDDYSYPQRICDFGRPLPEVPGTPPANVRCAEARLFGRGAFYKLGTEHGVLKQLYSRSEFSILQEKLLIHWHPWAQRKNHCEPLPLHNR